MKLTHDERRHKRQECVSIIRSDVGCPNENESVFSHVMTLIHDRSEREYGSL